MNLPWQDDVGLETEYVDTSKPEGWVVSDEADVTPERAPEPKPPSVTERVWRKARDRYEGAIYAPDSFNVPENKAMMCIICGYLTERRGNKPVYDDNNIAWCLCPEGCEPPEGMGTEATMLSLSVQASDSVFDVWSLSPGDFMGPTEDELQAKVEAESVSGDDDDEDGAILRKSPTHRDVCDRYGQSLGRRWVPTQRERPPRRD